MNDSHFKVLAIHDLRIGRMSSDIDGLPEPLNAESARRILGDTGWHEVARSSERKRARPCGPYDLTDGSRGTVNGGLRFQDAADRPLAKLPPAAREAVNRMRLDPVTRVTGDAAANRDTRLTRLGDLVGQRGVIRNLRRAAQAAVTRGAPPCHVLLCGRPGLGKTSLARAVAAELGRDCRTVHAPLVTEPAELARHAAEVGPGGVLFIDEAHRLPVRVAESLYTIMDAGRMTVIGATTDSRRLPGAFRSRFAIRQTLRYYAAPELAAIVRRAARDLGVAIDLDAALVLARAARDTPREAELLLSAACDEALVRAQPPSTQ